MGLLASLLSAVFAASKDLVSKRLASQLDGTTSTFASFAFALPYYVVVLGILVYLEKETLTWSRAFLTMVLLRAVTDSLAEWMKMHALAHGDISLVATFFSISPLFLLFLSPLITQDPVSWPRAVALVLVVAGSFLLVYHPSARGWGEQKKGILLAIGASVFFALNSCFDRLAVQEGTPVFAGFTMTFLSAVFLLPLVMFRRDRLNAMREQQGSLWIRGLLEVAFMTAKLYALQILQAPDVVGLQRLSLVLSILGGRVFFKEEDLGRRLMAGILILGGVVLIAWLQW